MLPGYQGPRKREETYFKPMEFESNNSLLQQAMSSRDNMNRNISDLANIQPNTITKEQVVEQIVNDRQPASAQEMKIYQGENGGSGPVIYDDGMFNSYTGLRGNKAFRNNNPGNISGMGGNLLYGAAAFARNKTGDAGDRSQLVFNSPKDGWRALYTLASSKRYNNAPIEQAFSKYQTNQDAWRNMLGGMRKYGIDPSKSTFNQLSPEQKVWFLNQRANHEGYTGHALTQDMLY